MASIAEAITAAGAVTFDMVAELKKWGLPVEDFSEAAAEDAEDAVNLIHEVLEGQDLVEIRETDFEILRYFLQSQRKGKLVLISGDETGQLDCSFGFDPRRGEYVIPWRSDAVTDLLTNSRSYLRDGRRKVFFSDHRYIYFGKEKSFVSLSPLSKEGETCNT